MDLIFGVCGRKTKKDPGGRNELAQKKSGKDQMREDS